MQRVPDFYNFNLNRMPSLCDKLGGEGAIAAVVDKFYEFMLADPHAASFFTKTDMPKQRKQQTAFLVKAFAGADHYNGKEMKTIHKDMKICSKDFNATWDHMEKALHHFNVAADLIAQVKKVFYSFEGDIRTV